MNLPANYVLTLLFFKNISQFEQQKPKSCGVSDVSTYLNFYKAVGPAAENRTVIISLMFDCSRKLFTSCLLIYQCVLLFSTTKPYLSLALHSTSETTTPSVSDLFGSRPSLCFSPISSSLYASFHSSRYVICVALHLAN